MRSGTTSMLIGATVAAFLVLPAMAADNGWVVWPTKSYNTGALRVGDIVGNVRVNVQDGPMKVDVSGNRNLVSNLTVKTDGNTLRISGSGDVSYNVWDWRRWFDFSNVHSDDGGKLFIKITVPKGTDVRVEDLVGNATIGDTYGPVRLETTAGDATVGRVASARVSMAGSGKIAIADVAGALRLEIAGSGRVTAGHAGSVEADIAGSGDTQIGAISGGAGISIAGSGDFTASKVNGPVKVSIAGSGNVKIADGLADPLRLEIFGAGDFYFGGVAVNPRISALGSGNIRIKAYRGKLSNDGMASVQIGDKITVTPGHGHHDDDDDDGE